MPNVGTSEKKPIFAMQREAPDSYLCESISVAQLAARAITSAEAFQRLVAPVLFNEQTCGLGSYPESLFTSALPRPVAEQTAAWLADTILSDSGDDDNLRKPVIAVSNVNGRFEVERLGVSDVFTQYELDAEELLEAVMNQGLAVFENRVLLTNDLGTLNAQFAVLAPLMAKRVQVAA